jgi:hypothetical protein
VASCLGTAAAQSQSRPEPDTEIGELLRRATAGENEDGFCSRVGWARSPSGSIAVPAFIEYLKAAKVGTWKAVTFVNGNCQYDRVTDISQVNGGRCVEYTYWACIKGGRCGFKEGERDCLSPKGELLPRKK